MYNTHQSDDEEDEFALRQAALRTLRRKDVQVPKPTPNTFLRNNKYPNLITIVPVVETPLVQLPPPVQRKVSSPLNASLDEIAATLIPPQQQQHLSKPLDKKEIPNEEQEVSTKFTRLEDTESESEDDIDLGKKNSGSSDESDDECLDLEDDDSLEALMAQMEQEFKTEPGSEVKKEGKSKKRQKNNKEKDKLKENDKPKESDKTKESEKSKEIDKPKECDKLKEDEIINKQDESKPKIEVKKAAAIVEPLMDIGKESIKVTKVNVDPLTETKLKEKRKSPFQEMPSVNNYVKARSNSRSRSRSPVSLRTTRRISPMRRKSPVWTPRDRSKSPARSLTPVRNTPPRKFIPNRLSQERFSPVRKLSPGRSVKSPSPYSRDKYSYPRKDSRSLSPSRKRSSSPLPRKDRSRSRSPYYGSRSPSARTRRSRRSLTPVTNNRNSKSSRLYSPPYRQYSRSPVGRRSVSPRGRKFSSRSPSPRYITNFVPRRRLSPRRKVVSPRSKSPLSPDRRSLSPQNKRSLSPQNKRSLSPQNKRSLSPRLRRSVSPRRRDYSPRRRDLITKADTVHSRKSSPAPRRNPAVPEGNYRRYNSPRSPVRKEKSPSPHQATPPPRRRSPLPLQRIERQEQPRNKSNYQKAETADKQKSWSCSPSLSLSPSPPPRDRNGAPEDSTRRYKSPLRVRKGNTDGGFYNKATTSRRPPSPDSKTGTSDVRDRRRNGRNWEKRNWENRRVEKRRERNTHDNKKDTSKIEREVKEVSPPLKITDDPVLEARRKKFESNDLVEPSSKKIRLKKETTPVKEKKVENSVQTDDKMFDRSSNIREEKLEYNESSGADSFEKVCNMEEDVLDLSAEVWSSDEGDFILKPNGKSTNFRKVIRSATPPAVKRGPVKERITLKNKVTERLKPVSVTASTSTEVKHVDMLDKASSPLTVVHKEDKETDAVNTNDESPAETDVKALKKDEVVDSDLRAELSRRRAERLTKAGLLHESLPARLLQNAFEGVMGKKKVSRTEVKEKSVKVKKGTSPLHRLTPPKEKSDGRRVLLLKRPSHAVRIPTSINVTIAEESQDGSDSDENEESDGEKYRRQRKLPIHMRLGISDEQRRPPHKGRKVKVKHRNQV